VLQHADQIVAYLRRDEIIAGRNRVRRLKAKMVIDRPNQVRYADITFIPVRHGFLYLVAIMDWATRKVLSWRLSNTMHADFCVEALEEAIGKFGPSEIMNADSHTIGASSRVV